MMNKKITIQSEPQDHKALADAIIKVLSDSDLLRTVSMNARTSVERSSLHKRVEEFIEFGEALIQKMKRNQSRVCRCH